MNVGGSTIRPTDEQNGTYRKEVERKKGGRTDGWTDTDTILIIAAATAAASGSKAGNRQQQKLYTMFVLCWRLSLFPSPHP